MTTKTCTKCKSDLPLDSFNKHRRNRDGLDSWCRQCKNAASRNWAKSNPEKVKAYSRMWNLQNPEKRRNLKRLYRQRHPQRAAEQVRKAVRKKWDTKYRPDRWRRWLQEKYGITEAQFDAIVQKQKNRCAICKNVQSQGPRRPNLCVDHCHVTGRVRGLLCFKCNVMLGAIGDSQKTLRAAIRYLKEHEL